MAIHVVKSGENLWSISRQYDVPISTITQVNGLLSLDLLVPGLALYIPGDGLSIRTHQISAGDVLWKLAYRYNTSISSILSANPGINPNLLSIGQRLMSLLQIN